MTYNKTKTIKNAYEIYLKSNLYTLNDCYANASYNKQKAYNYCRDLLVKYNGRQGRILGYNTMVFSYGFIGEMDGKPAFFYITRDHDRYIFVEDLNK